ncbi:hypothetical protein I4U23_013112 [Adineta vaga]|nr:hypothetical protein I4U23_013112 [Adineta vaga]
MMATSNIPLTKMIELVKCPICLDYYNDPRLLPCSHTFCFTCISQLAKYNNTTDDDDDSDDSDGEEPRFICPLKDGTYVFQYQLNSLPVNRIVQNMVELLSSPSSLSNDTFDQKIDSKLFCEICLERTSKVWCPTCSQQLCSTCIVFHNNKFTHATTSIADRTSSICDQHTTEILSLWCTQCRLRLCPLCLPNNDQHNQHQKAIQPIEKVIEEARAEVEKCLQKLDYIEVDFTTLSERTTNMIQNQEENYRKTQQKFDTEFLRLTRLIEERKETLDNEFSDRRVTILSSLHHIEMTTHQQLNRIKSLITSNRRILDDGNTMQLLETSNYLNSICNEISDNHQELISNCITEETTYTDSVYDKMKIQNLLKNFGKLEMNSKKTLICSVRQELILSQPTATAQRFYTGSFIFGYSFRLERSIRLTYISIESTYIGTITASLYDEKGVKQKESSHESVNNTFKWISIPMNETQLMNQYSLLIWSNDSQGSIGYQQRSSIFHQVNQICAVVGIYSVKKNKNSTEKQIEMNQCDRAINMRLVYQLEK